MTHSVLVVCDGLEAIMSHSMRNHGLLLVRF